MTKKEFHNSIKFIEVNDIKNNRFAFIADNILKENISIKMQHIVFLISLEKEYKLPGAVVYSTFKTIIIFTASIVESLLHYKINELIKNNRVAEEDIMGTEEVSSNCKELYKISATEKICGVKIILKAKKLSDNTSFNELNKAAKRSGLFNDNLFKKAEKIRIIRNRIHPYGLKEVDNKYSKKEINDIFSMASEIIEAIEKY